MPYAIYTGQPLPQTYLLNNQNFENNNPRLANKDWNRVRDNEKLKQETQKCILCNYCVCVCCITNITTGLPPVPSAFVAIASTYVAKKYAECISKNDRNR